MGKPRGENSSWDTTGPRLVQNGEKQDATELLSCVLLWHLSQCVAQIHASGEQKLCSWNLSGHWLNLWLTPAVVQRYKCSLQGRMNKFLKPLGTNKTLGISQESVLVPLFPPPSCPGMYLLWPVLGKLNLPICVLCSERLEVPFLFQFCPTHL